MHSLDTACLILQQHRQVMGEALAFPAFSLVICSSIRMVEELVTLQSILVVDVLFMQAMRQMALRFPAITTDSQLVQEELLANCFTENKIFEKHRVNACGAFLLL